MITKPLFVTNITRVFGGETIQLFRHYKNKLYKFRELVKHSETAEDMVLYDCLYENESGRTWVRPRDLFFGEIEIDGTKKKRFQELKVTIESRSNATLAEIEPLFPVFREILGDLDIENIRTKFRDHRGFHLDLAKVDTEVAGFKLGYWENPDVFYSWLGGTRARFQRLGIATLLLEAQHSWCTSQSYRKVRTKTTNRTSAMLSLNLQNGFLITGTEQEPGKDLKILLEKNLDQVPGPAIGKSI